MLLQNNEIYRVRNELIRLLNWPNRPTKEELTRRLQHLRETCCEYEIINTHPLKIKITNVFGEYKECPKDYTIKRKTANPKGLIRTYLKDVLNKTQFRPLDIPTLAWRIIQENNLDYTKESFSAIIEAVLKEDAEQDYHNHIWINKFTYEPMREAALWKEILQKHDISPQRAAIEWFIEGDHTTALKNYEEAQEEYRRKTGVYPILVRGWRLKDSFIF